MPASRCSSSGARLVPCSPALCRAGSRPATTGRRVFEAGAKVGSAAVARAAQRGAVAERVSYLAPHVSAAFASAGLLQLLCERSNVPLDPSWLPLMASVLSGGALGVFVDREVKRFVNLNRLRGARLRVVVTGATRGIGRALAREFLLAGDEVFITARGEEGVRETVRALREQTGVGAGRISGHACDVSTAEGVEGLKSAVRDRMGSADVWVNNAGFSASYSPFLSLAPGDIAAVCETNLLGAMLGTRAALHLALEELRAGGGGRSGGIRSGVQVFNMDGAGFDGSATPQYAAYGATKCAVAQLNRSLHEEAVALEREGSRAGRRHGTLSDGEEWRVGVHTLSPGMVITDLLLSGAHSVDNLQKFNIICEHPETVASFLAPRVRSAYATGGSGSAIRYLTPARAVGFLLNYSERVGRFFDGEGNKVYAEEEERVQDGKHERRQGEVVQPDAVAGRIVLMHAASFLAMYCMLSTVSSAQASVF